MLMANIMKTYRKNNKTTIVHEKTTGLLYMGFVEEKYSPAYPIPSQWYQGWYGGIALDYLYSGLNIARFVGYPNLIFS